MKRYQRLTGGIGVRLHVRQFCPSSVGSLQSEKVACAAAAFDGRSSRPMQTEEAEGVVLSIARLPCEQPGFCACHPLVHFLVKLLWHVQLHGAHRNGGSGEQTVGLRWAG